jgi:hypothetical protein
MINNKLRQVSVEEIKETLAVKWTF